MISVCVWNCNGMLWSSPGSVHDIIHQVDLILFMETHESVVKGLPSILGYSWISAHRTPAHLGGNDRGSGGVAFLVNDLFPRICIESTDTHGRFIWITFPRDPTLRQVYIVGCYFLPASSRVVQDLGESSYLDLFPYITRYSM